MLETALLIEVFSQLTKENPEMKRVFLSFTIIWFLLVPFTQCCEAALPLKVKNIITQITSTVIDNSFNRVQEKFTPIDNPAKNVRLLTPHRSASLLQKYFPLNNNDVKYYQGTALRKSYSATYQYLQVFYNGRSCYLEKDSLDGSMTYYGYSGSELQIYGATIGDESYPLLNPLTILNDNILANGGTLHSTSYFIVEGYQVTLNVTVESALLGPINIDLGTLDDCRSIEMTFIASIPGDSEKLDMLDVWVLAPDIGKLKIVLLDQLLNPRGWLTLTGGIVGGVLATDIISPKLAIAPSINSLSITPESGTAPLFITAKCNANDPDGGSIVEYRWDFNNDGIVDNVTDIGGATYNFVSAGSYEICCTVVDDEGQTSKKLIFLNVDEKPQYVDGNYNYYLPYFSSADSHWTGLGLVNRNQENSTSLQVTVYENNGYPIATAGKTIPAFGQEAFTIGEQLNKSGWMLINSHQPLSGLAFLGSQSIPFLMADIPFVSELSLCMVIPHIAQDDYWDTTVLICNPNNENASLVLKNVDKDGVVQGTKNCNILPYGSGNFLLSEVFNDKVPLAGRLEINSSVGIASFALYTDKKSGGTYYAGINAENCE